MGAVASFQRGYFGDAKYHLGRLSVKAVSYRGFPKASLAGGAGEWQETEGVTCGKLHQVKQEDRKASSPCC